MKTILPIVALLLTLTGCAFGESDSEGQSPIDGPPLHILMPIDGPRCLDQTPSTECGSGINLSAPATQSLPILRKFFAFKYKPASAMLIGKICIAAPPPTAQTKVYLLSDSGGTPGYVLKEGDMYDAGGGMICTLNAPFDFTANVDNLHTYWIASDADYPSIAPTGNQIPYWYGDSDPGVSETGWTYKCSAGFVAKISATCR